MAPDLVDDWREVLVLDAALETGLIAALAEGPWAVEELAGALGLDPRAVRIVGAALADFGVAEERGEELALAPRGRDLLEPTGEGRDPAGEIALSARSMANHLRLAETLRSGSPPDDVSAGDDATRELFMRAMRNVAAPRAAAATAALGRPPPGGRLLDVGGAPGTYARSFAASGWAVTVLDLPETLALGAPGLAADGVAAVPGDATRAMPEGPWHAVYLGNLVHLFDPVTAAALVARAGAALAPGGLLAVQEVVHGRSPQAPRFGVLMLLGTAGGDAYTEAEYAGWMAAAGAPVDRVVELEGGWHLLLGRRSLP